MRPRILIVANQGSVHTTGWVNTIDHTKWDVSLFALDYAYPPQPMDHAEVYYPFRQVHPRRWINRVILRQKVPPLVQHRKPWKNIWPIPFVPHFIRYLNGIKRRLVRNTVYHPCFGHNHVTLNRLIAQLKPDIIHSMDFQQAGYLVARAKAACRGTFPTWIATNWGSDLYYFPRFPEHRAEIGRVLAGIDYYSCECCRDIRIAREFGYKGRTLPVFPNTGGFDLEAVAPARMAIPAAERKIILVKGYQHFAGRALTALAALERIAPQLAGYKIIVFSGFACPDVLARAEQLKAGGVLDIDCLPYISKQNLMDYYAQARIYLGVSISDAISTSVLESMVYGVFPIQTNTSCCDEWIVDGETGFVIPHDDIDVIADRVLRAATDDALVTQASTRNWEVARARLSADIIRAQVDAFYEEAHRGDAPSAQV